MPFIGLDLGTTNVKAVAFAPDDYRELAKASVALDTLTPQNNRAEQSPDVVWQAVVSVLNDVVNQLSNEKLVVDGVSLSAAMHSLLALNGHGKPLTNALLWSDNRAEKQAQTLRSDTSAQTLQRHTGVPIHPMLPLCKLAWFNKHNPGLTRRAAKWISLKEYVWWKLTGHYQLDVSLAAATGLYSSFSGGWPGPALSFAGVRDEQLSALVPTTFIATLSNVAELALPAGTPLCIGGSDGCMANLGAGAVGPGITTITIGTSGAVRRTIAYRRPDPHGRLFCYPLDVGADAQHYVIGGPTNNGANVLQWLSENLLKMPVEAVLAEAATAPPGAEGLLFRPYLHGERAPLWDATVRGSFHNLGPQHGRAHLARAVLEGVTFNLLAIEKCLAKSAGKTRVIHANGGFARSAFWVQLLADVFGVPVRLNASNESGATGAVLLMQKALGQFTTLTEAAGRVPFGATFSPDSATYRTYQRQFAEWQKLSD